MLHYFLGLKAGCIYACLLIPLCAFANQVKYQFSIESQRADQALTLFAQQANTTLLFPYDLAQKETTNALHGEYTIELGIIKLLEGTGLYPTADDSGLFSVKPILSNDSTSPQQNNNIDVDLNAEQSELTATEMVMEKIAVVGTRASPRSVLDSTVPLDIIDAKDFKQQGSTDVLSMLSNLVPSINVNDQPINDASSLVRPANLRGMSSDHTLVLLNGKRRHRSAVITFLGGGLSDGAQGPDISTIPASALKQIEVLRDGAAAQYGSDAIAGVINFVMKDDSEGGSIELQSGGYYAGDGEMWQLKGNLGLPLLEAGFINLSAEYQERNETSRSKQRTDAQLILEAGNQFVPRPAQIWGTPKLLYDAKFSANLGYELTDKLHFYSFINLAQRKIEGGFYYRNPHTRDGVYGGEVDSDGTPLLLVGDLDGLDNGVSCPQVRIEDNNVLDDASFALISDNNTAVGQNCFAFNELFPGGFTPRFGGVVSDAALFVGIKGETPSDWLYDLSASVGYSHIEYSLSNTVNPSLGPNSPTEFSPGSARQLEKNINLDISKQFDNQFSLPINLGLGIEWRRESYAQQAGDPASYEVGTLAFDPRTGNGQGFGIGSNGFPGYKPASAGEWGRGNWAVYVDVETQATDQLLLALAARYEDFTDFGSTFDGKLSGRFELTDSIAIRGSFSSGFKAPTVGQNNVINVTTAYASGGLEDQATLPPSNPISIQLGATLLKPEQSVNQSLGIVGQLGNDLYVTLDYFNVRLRDRISTTSALPLTEQDINVLLAQGVSDASSFSSAKYFTNDFDTTTQGIDFVVNYHTILADIDTQFIFAYNWTDTQVDRVTLYNRVSDKGEVFQESNLTAQRIHMIEDNLPGQRANFTVKQQYGNLHTLVRLNYFDAFYEDHLDASAGLDIDSSEQYLVDVELSYAIDSSFILALGAKNLFNHNPDVNPYYGLVGAKYPPTSPTGINGGFYYLRASYQF